MTWTGELAPPTGSTRTLQVGEVVEGVMGRPKIVPGWRKGELVLQIKVGGRTLWAKPQLHRILADKDVAKGDTIRIVRLPDKRIGNNRRMADFKVKVLRRHAPTDRPPTLERGTGAPTGRKAGTKAKTKAKAGAKAGLPQW